MNIYVYISIYADTYIYVYVCLHQNILGELWNSKNSLHWRDWEPCSCSVLKAVCLNSWQSSRIAASLWGVEVGTTGSYLTHRQGGSLLSFWHWKPLVSIRGDGNLGTLVLLLVGEQAAAAKQSHWLAGGKAKRGKGKMYFLLKYSSIISGLLEGVAHNRVGAFLYTKAVRKIHHLRLPFT